MKKMVKSSQLFKALLLGGLLVPLAFSARAQNDDQAIGRR